MESKHVWQIVATFDKKNHTNILNVQLTNLHSTEREKIPLL